MRSFIALKSFLLLLIAVVENETLAQIIFSSSKDGKGDGCLTPAHKVGGCVSIRKCPQLLAMLSRSPLTAEAVSFLRRSQCGFDGRNPKVCCERRKESRRGSQSLQSGAEHPNAKLLEHARCGAVQGERILGGNYTRLGEFPWTALLAYSSWSSARRLYSCGGSVVSARYVVTAAHCVSGISSNMNLVGVRVGEYDRRLTEACEDGSERSCPYKVQDFRLERRVVHPQYSRKTFQNDIALLRLDRPIDFAPANARPICLPIGSAANIMAKKLIVVGWGVTETRVASDRQMKVALPVYPHARCVERYRAQAPVTDNQICVGGEMGRDSCNGDSGGPLQGVALYNRRPRFVLYGIVSFGTRNCGAYDFPGVYTRVDRYLRWMLDNMAP